MLIDLEHRAHPLIGIAFAVVMTLCVAAILWLTSQRAQVAPGTLAVGVGAGTVLGVAVYAVAPLGLSKAATNPWLPGSDVDLLVLLAWVLVLVAPLAAASLAQRRYFASGSPTTPAAPAVTRQFMAAGLVTGLVGALLATALGIGTIALMLKAAWLRNWLYHGHRQFFGIAGLRSVLDGNLPAITYSHQLTASADTGMFLAMCVAFPLTALALTGLPALGAAAEPEAQQGGGGPPRGGSGPPSPDTAPSGPAGARPATSTRATTRTSAVNAASRHGSAAKADHNRLTVS